jgi:L-alanine-DL-glutamate epimerase-like enolase superfamily enzyme
MKTAHAGRGPELTISGLRVRALDGEGLAWIEEPTSADDYRGHAETASATRTPIQLGVL